MGCTSLTNSGYAEPNSRSQARDLTTPPSTRNVAPLIAEASGLQMKATRAATSDSGGRPRDQSGLAFKLQFILPQMKNCRAKAFGNNAVCGSCLYEGPRAGSAEFKWSGFGLANIGPATRLSTVEVRSPKGAICSGQVFFADVPYGLICIVLQPLTPTLVSGILASGGAVCYTRWLETGGHSLCGDSWPSCSDCLRSSFQASL
jgi:hypothetical protein